MMNPLMMMMGMGFQGKSGGYNAQKKDGSKEQATGVTQSAPVTPAPDVAKSGALQ